MKKSFKAILIALSLSGMLSGMAYAGGETKVFLRNHIDSTNSSDKIEMSYVINSKIPATNLKYQRDMTESVEKGAFVHIRVFKKSDLIYQNTYTIKRTMTITCIVKQHTVKKAKPIIECFSNY